MNYFKPIFWSTAIFVMSTSLVMTVTTWIPSFRYEQVKAETRESIEDLQVEIDQLIQIKTLKESQKCIAEKQNKYLELVGFKSVNWGKFADIRCEDGIDYEPVDVGNFISTKEGGVDNFLKVNGAEFVKEAGDLFRASGLIYNIKPEVLVCIAQADSSLGKALKTTNNIGNVGNTDSGAVKHYSSLGLAIAGMGETLNNQYMKGNTIIGQLSQGGRNIINTKYSCSQAPSPYKCYASSEYNWNKNTLGCLRDIFKDKTINENFEFRTVK